MLPPSPSSPLSLSVGGVPLPDLVKKDVVEVVVNTSLHMPGMFVIRLNSENTTGAGLAPLRVYKYIDPPTFAIGMPVAIRAVPGESSPIPSPPQPLISGEITAIEAEFGEDQSVSLVIRGYDKSHRLHRGKKTATYLLMTDNLIVQRVTATAGVLCTALPTTSPPREYVLQNNQSDWDFLQGIAKRNGYELVVNALGVLMFKPIGTPVPGLPALLTWGKDLTSFRPRMSAAFQEAQVMVQGWDPKLKMPITGLGIAPPAIGGGAAVLPMMAASRTIFGISKDIVVDEPVASNLEAAAIAKARMTDKQVGFLQAEGECTGNPSVRAGSQIAVMGVGNTFSGPYLVSSATHVYKAGVGYSTQFSITGSQPDTIRDLVNGGADGDGHGRMTGVVIGVVTNNIDPLQLGRVKVKFPHLGGLPPVESNWCRIAAPMAGGQMSGFYAIPEINDEVLVAFEHGDPNYPYVLGGLWNNLDRPPKPTAAVVIGGKVTKRIIRSRSGHEITLDDTPGKEMISIVDKSMLNKIEIDTLKKSMAINVMGNCEITAQTGDIKIGALAKDVTIDCLNFKVNAKANAQITALANMELKATAQFKAQGMAGVKVESPALAEFKGSLTKIG